MGWGRMGWDGMGWDGVGMGGGCNGDAGGCGVYEISWLG